MYEKRTTRELSANASIILRVEDIEKSPAHPAGLHFAIIGRIRLAGECKEVIRIDNSLHKGRGGTHIHFLDKQGKHVEYAEDLLNPEHAYDYVVRYLQRNYAYLMEGDENAPYRD